MDVYFLRHGKAEAHSKSGRDEDRVLLPEGRQTIEALALVLAKLKVQFNCILSSPYARAFETAQIISKNVRGAPKPEVCKALGCGATTREVSKELTNLGEVECVLLVGHMPDLGEIVSELTHFTQAIEFKTGSLCRLKIDAPFRSHGIARLTLYLKPKDYLLLV